MAKITLDDITSNYASVVQLNARFQLIEDAFNSSVLYRDNPVGQPNSMQNDLDMNSNDILNANNVYVSDLYIDGRLVSSSPFYTTISGNFQLTSGQTAVDIGLDASNVTVHVSGPDVDGERLLRNIDYTTTGNIINLVESYPAGSYISVHSYEDSEVDNQTTLVAVDTYTGTGAQTTFTLSNTPLGTNNIWTYVDGVYQNKATYGITANQIVFSEAPPLNSEIEVSYGYTLASLSDYLKVSNNLSDVGNVATARTNLGLVIGTDVQAYDATILNDADIGVTVQAYDVDTAKLDVVQSFTAAQTFSADVTFANSYTETVYALSGTTPSIDPANGTIQTWAVSGASTPMANIASGQSLTLMVVDSGSAGVTWPSVTWVGGSAPTLATTGYTVISLWKVSTTLYGSSAGDVA